MKKTRATHIVDNKIDKMVNYADVNEVVIDFLKGRREINLILKSGFMKIPVRDKELAMLIAGELSRKMITTGA